MTRVNKSGFQRNDAKGRPRFDLIPTGELEELALLYGHGADCFGVRNWEKADSQEDIDSFIESAFRHFIQCVNGDEDENHGIRAIWNIIGILHTRKKLNKDTTK